MSEFSESYHLRSADIADGVGLLQRAGLKGYVFPPQQGWVPIVAAENSFAPDQRIVSENQGTLLHYVSAEDHGWSFSLFEHQRLVCDYHCGWDDDIRIDESRYSSAALARILGADGRKAVAAIEPILHPADFEAVMEAQPWVVFAEAMKLPRFHWFAYDYVARDFQERPQDFPGVAQVT